ncbi:MAG: hypothetical protein J1F11_07610 [Oscillospiraceae bacterium]|nr:hypothetical protein [Oscillospiraceae bacterium]
MGILLGRWDCEYCSKKGIPADVRHCPSCGNPVGQNVKYYLPQGSKDYVDPKVVPKGADWKCGYCESYNRSDSEVCSNCGAPKGAGKDYFQNHAENAARSSSADSSPGNTGGNTYYGGGTAGEASSYYSRGISGSSSSSYYSYPQKKDFNYWLKWIIAGIAVIAVIIGIAAIVTPKEKTLTVEGFSWERTLYIEKYKTVRESGWNIPSGGRLQYTREEVRSYDHQFVGYRTETYTEQEIDHYESYVSGYRDLGNGYFEEIIDQRPVYRTVTKTREVPQYVDVPVYDTKYYYDIDKWVKNHTVDTNGRDQEPYWGQEPPASTGSPKLGDERVSSRSETYRIIGTLSGTKNSRSYEIGYSDWEKLKKGDSVRCKVYASGKIEFLKDQ